MKFYVFNSKLIKRYILKHYFTITRFGRIAGVDPTTITRGLNGEHSLKINTLTKILNGAKMPKYDVKNVFTFNK